MSTILPTKLPFDKILTEPAEQRLENLLKGKPEPETLKTLLQWLLFEQRITAAARNVEQHLEAFTKRFGERTKLAALPKPATESSVFFHQIRRCAALFFFKNNSLLFLGNAALHKEILQDWMPMTEPADDADIEFLITANCDNFLAQYPYNITLETEAAVVIPIGLELSKIVKPISTLQFQEVLSYALSKPFLYSKYEKHFQAQQQLYELVYARLYKQNKAALDKEFLFSSFPFPVTLPHIQDIPLINRADFSSISRVFMTAFSSAPISYTTDIVQTMQLQRPLPKDKNLRWGKLMRFVPHLIDGLLLQSRRFELIEIKKKSQTVYCNLLVAEYTMSGQTKEGFIVYGFQDADRTRCISRYFVPKEKRKILEIIRGDDTQAGNFPLHSLRDKVTWHQGALPQAKLKTSFNPPLLLLEDNTIGLTIRVMGLERLTGSILSPPDNP